MESPSTISNFSLDQTALPDCRLIKIVFYGRIGNEESNEYPLPEINGDLIDNVHGKSFIVNFKMDDYDSLTFEQQYPIHIQKIFYKLKKAPDSVYVGHWEFRDGRKVTRYGDVRCVLVPLKKTLFYRN